VNNEENYLGKLNNDLAFVLLCNMIKFRWEAGEGRKQIVEGQTARSRTCQKLTS